MMHEVRKFFVYCIVGFLATGTHYAVMVGLVHWGGVSEVIATCAGYIAGSVVKYPLNYGWVFSSKERHGAAVVKYVVALGIGFLLNAAVFAALLRVLDAYYMVSQVLTTGIVLFANYLLARYWIFFTRGTPEKSA
jgi:putative flippase GtrA